MPGSPPLELDHVFVFVPPGAADARRALAALGLRKSFARDHPGQGTSNLCYCFDNAYLELLWLRDRAEAERPPVARTRLSERARWRETGASPFGIALRAAAAGGAASGGGLPFESYHYAAPFLPPGVAIPVARCSDDPRQPFLFRSPGRERPDQWDDGRAGNRQQAAGLAEIVALQLDLPADVEPASALRRLEGAGLLTLTIGASTPAMVLTLSAEDSRARRRLTLPAFAWID